MSVRVPQDLGRASLILVMAGLAVLYAVKTVYTPEAVAVAAIDGSRMGETVRVTGTVSGVQDGGDTVFFTLREGSSSVRAVSFKHVSGLKAGETYRVTGRVDVYRGEPELIVHAVSRAE